MNILSLYCGILLKMQINFIISYILMKISYSVASWSHFTVITVITNNNSEAEELIQLFKIKFRIFLNFYIILISAETV